MESSRDIHRFQRMERGERESEFARLVAFSDGVFAIAITLLVLPLDVPNSASQLGASLEDQIPDLLAFALSFAVLARVWSFHHRLFGAVSEFDGMLIGLNFLYLAFVVLVPFTSEMIGDFGGEPHAVIAYAINMGLLGLVGSVMVEYAFRKELVRPEVYELRGLYTGAPNWVFPVVFLGSIPVALVSTTAAVVMWIFVFVLGRSTSVRLARNEARD